MFLFFHKHMITLMLIVYIVLNGFSQTNNIGKSSQEIKLAPSISTENDLALDKSSARSPSNESSDFNSEIQLDENTLFLGDETTQNVVVKPFGIWNTIKVFFVLIILLAVGVGVVFLLKKLQTSQSSSNEEVIDIVSSRSLSQGTALHVIKIGTGFILIGTSSSSVDIIKDFSNKEDIDEINLVISTADSNNKGTQSNKKHISFIQKLQKKLYSSNNNKINANTSVLSLFRGSGKGTRT